MSLIYKKTSKVLNFNKENPVTYYKLQQLFYKQRYYYGF